MVASTPTSPPHLEDVFDRVAKLEFKVYSCPSDQKVDESMRRSRQHVESCSPLCLSSIWKWVPPTYYSLDLPSRAKILHTHSVDQLCKAMLMENRSSAAPSDCSDRTNSKFYLVVVQYAATINTKKLGSEIRGLRSVQSGTRLDPARLDFRVAREADSDRITGFMHNSVSPFGMLDQTVPIVLSKSVVGVEPAFMWMGGGHVDLKLGMAVSEFVKAVDALVLDVSDSR